MRILLLTSLLIASQLGLTVRAFPPDDPSESSESVAVGSMRSINTAQAFYSKAYSTVGFACALEDLGAGPAGSKPSARHAGLLDETLTSGKAKEGYKFRVHCAAKSQPQK